jgi:hypothetical protein
MDPKNYDIDDFDPDPNNAPLKSTTINPYVSPEYLNTTKIPGIGDMNRHNYPSYYDMHKEIRETLGRPTETQKQGGKSKRRRQNKSKRRRRRSRRQRKA